MGQHAGGDDPFASNFALLGLTFESSMLESVGAELEMEMEME
jgi:hypothetical protein